MKNKKIIIMDFATCEVHIYDFDPNIWASPENFLVFQYSEHGLTFTEDQCNFMVVDIDQYEGRLPIYIH